MNQPRSRQISNFAFVLGAVVFGMVLAGGLGVTPRASSGPATVASSGPIEAPALRGGLPSFADLASAVDPAVVSVRTTTIEERPRGPRQIDPFQFFNGPNTPRQRRPFPAPEDDDPQRSDSSGSGFVVSADGLVVTNYHVIEGGTEVKVQLDDREYVAKVRGTDPATDLALLKIDAGEDLTYLRLGDSEGLRVGEWVMAIGSPLRLDHTVTVGVVSGKGRQLRLAETSFENFIQTDAAINFGNSGGPLINLAGEVVGINTAINYGADNIGFAVPVNTLKQILPQLRESGKVRRGYLGINIRDVDHEMAEAYKLDRAEGALVLEVVKGTPAEKAGLRSEDIVLKVDSVVVRKTRDLIDYVSAQGPDKSVTLEILRDGELRKLKIDLAERQPSQASAQPAPEQDQRKLEWLGLRYQDLTDEARQAHGIDDSVKGVWVTSVAPTSPLYEEGLAPNQLFHVISKVNGKEVSDVAEFEREIKKVAKGSRVRLYVRTFQNGEEGPPILAFPQAE